jgi:hypothetical protein
MPSKVLLSGMVYRDDLDAAHARIAALEAENEQLREELDALRGIPAEPAVLDKPPAPAPPAPRAVKTIVTGTEAARRWGEITSLQADIVSESDLVERARLMRRLADLLEVYYAWGDQKAIELRRVAAKLDPDG